MLQQQQQFSRQVNASKISLFSSFGPVMLILVLLGVGLAVCICKSIYIQTKKSPEIQGNPDFNPLSQCICKAIYFQTKKSPEIQGNPDSVHYPSLQTI